MKDRVAGGVLLLGEGVVFPTGSQGLHCTYQQGSNAVLLHSRSAAPVFV